MSDAVRDLEKLTRDIAEAETDLNRTEGKIAGMLEQLKKEHNCASVEEAEEKYKLLTKGIEADTTKRDAGVEKLKQALAEKTEEEDD